MKSGSRLFDQSKADQQGGHVLNSQGKGAQARAEQRARELYRRRVQKDRNNFGSGSIEDGTFRIDPDRASRHPGEGIGAVTKAEFELYEQLYQPKIKQSIETALDEDFVSDAADKAGEETREVFDASTGQIERRVSRFGGSVSGEQREQLDRNQDLNRALAVASSENSARSSAERTQRQQLQGAMDIGTSFLSSGNSNLGQAASMAASRERAERQAEAQEDANDVSMATTAAGLAIAMM
jgi:hypothetical protein